MERIADGQPPLIFGDGLQTMDFVYTVDIARANILAGLATSARASTTSPAARRPACSVWPRRCSGHGLRPARRARPGPRRQRRHPAAGRHVRGAPGPRLRARRPASRTACASWSPGGSAAARGRSRWSRTLGGVVVTRINVMQPWLGAGGGRRGHRGDRVRLGRPGSAGRRVRGSLRRPHAGRPRRRRVQLHHRPAPRAGRRRRRAGDDVVVPSFSFIATANAAGLRRCASRCSPTSTRRPATSRPTRSRRRSRPPTRRSSSSTRAACPCDLAADPRALRPARHRRRRGRRLRRRLDLPRAAGRVRAPRSRPGRSTRARSSPPARAA